MLKLEAEDGRGGLRQPRSKASGEIALALFEDEDNIHELSFTSTNNSCSLELLSVTYANDGDADRIEITVNKTLLANFTTYEVHNDGHNWNAFRTEIRFLIRLPVRDGYTSCYIHHTLKLYGPKVVIRYYRCLNRYMLCSNMYLRT